MTQWECNEGKTIAGRLLDITKGYILLESRTPSELTTMGTLPQAAPKTLGLVLLSLIVIIILLFMSLAYIYPHILFFCVKACVNFFNVSAYVFSHLTFVTTRPMGFRPWPVTHA